MRAATPRAFVVCRLGRGVSAVRMPWGWWMPVGPTDTGVGETTRAVRAATPRASRYSACVRGVSSRAGRVGCADALGLVDAGGSDGYRSGRRRPRRRASAGTTRAVRAATPRANRYSACVRRVSSRAGRVGCADALRLVDADGSDGYRSGRNDTRRASRCSACKPLLRVRSDTRRPFGACRLARCVSSRRMPVRPAAGAAGCRCGRVRGSAGQPTGSPPSGPTAGIGPPSSAPVRRQRAIALPRW